MKGASPPRGDSKVEVRGAEARYYDLLMNLITGGSYPFFIRAVMRHMGIQPDDAILDLGAGTGRNACLMRRYLSDRGRILGLDIGPEMLAQARRKCHPFSNVTFVNRRVEEALPYGGEFDVVFISFVLHGFVQEDRLRIVENAYRALRSGGRFFVLDYNEFDPACSPWPVRLAFRRVECPLASDFVKRDWRAILRGKGFGDFEVNCFYFGYVRLLAARKPPGFRPPPVSGLGDNLSGGRDGQEQTL
ncbi:MAG: methyltransferase domain-containing protein [Deltaproteobacteria bacterium]|nr:methyltransferase domain-containing protein [Deltaproteobacteria bacterium]MBW2121850.1 methyltransferase domain-containing protein [Deltaproteobacteria bacterium]